MSHEKTICPNCGEAGGIRAVHVLKGNAVTLVFFCAHCHYQWTVDKTPASGAGRLAPPKHQSNLGPARFRSHDPHADR